MWCQKFCKSEISLHIGVPESTPAGFCVFLSDPDPESKMCEETDLEAESLFNFGSCRRLLDHFSSKNMGEFAVGSMVAGVWTEFGFSNLKNFWSSNRIKKFWNRSGVEVWKSDSGHLWRWSESLFLTHALVTKKLTPAPPPGTEFIGNFHSDSCLHSEKLESKVYFASWGKDAAGVILPLSHMVNYVIVLVLASS